MTTPPFLQLLDRGTVGGAERHTWLLARALAGRGSAVTFAAPPGPLWDQIRAAPPVPGLALREEPALGGSPWRIRSWLARHLAGAGRDLVVHSHLARADTGAVLARRTAGLHARLVTTVHSRFHTDLPWRSAPLKRALYYPIHRWTLHRMDLVFAVSRTTAEQTRTHFGLPADRVVALQNALDLELLGERVPRDAARARLGAAEGKPVVACVGALTPRKGQHVLLDAVARLPAARRPAVWLIGEGPAHDALSAQVRRLGLEDVRLWGRRDDVPLLLSAADLYAQPSSADPLPRSLLEAMALGIPAIASRVDGIPELIDHGVAGWLVPPGDPAALADAMAHALGHPAEAAAVGACGQARVTARCSMPGMADAILAALAARERA